METKQISKHEAGLNEISNAVKNMVKRNIKYAKGILIERKTVHEDTIQIDVQFDNLTVFISDLNDMIGVQSVHFNQYTKKLIIEFVLWKNEAERIIDNYKED